MVLVSLGAVVGLTGLPVAVDAFSRRPSVPPFSRQRAIPGAQHRGGRRPGHLILHGHAMYGRDTARPASALLADGKRSWLGRSEPETRGSLFLQQGEANGAGLHGPVDAAPGTRSTNPYERLGRASIASYVWADADKTLCQASSVSTR